MSKKRHSRHAENNQPTTQVRPPGRKTRCVPAWTQRRRRRSMGYGGTGRPLRQRGRRLVLPMRAWLTPPHGRRHKPPPQPCALTTIHSFVLACPQRNRNSPFFKKTLTRMTPFLLMTISCLKKTTKHPPMPRNSTGDNLTPRRHTTAMMNHHPWIAASWYKRNMTHHQSLMTPYHPITYCHWFLNHLFLFHHMSAHMTTRYWQNRIELLPCNQVPNQHNC